LVNLPSLVADEINSTVLTAGGGDEVAVGLILHVSQAEYSLIPCFY